MFLTANGSLASFFSVMLALTVSTTSLSYLFIFPALLKLRRLYPDVRRPFRLPGGHGTAVAAVIITEAFVVVTGITLLWPGAINALFGQSYSIESSYGVSRAYFEWTTLGSFAVMVGVGVLFWALGERKLRTGLVGTAVDGALPPGALPPGAGAPGAAGAHMA